MPRYPTLARRLWSGAIADGTGCWPWQRYRDPDGYGKISHTAAHRVAYKIVKGPIPKGLEIDHLCRNRACINPDHLEAVTHRENMRRGVGSHHRLHALATHCKRGHLYDEANTYILRGARRGCRACQRAAVASYKARKAQTA